MGGGAGSGGSVGGSGGSVGGASGAGGAISADKIDLLFMIDNSRSMADKQEILRDAVPVLLERLINPALRQPRHRQQLSNPRSAAQCPGPLEREFKPIDDIHIGIVTSSLGGHGADTCSPASARSTQRRR